PLSPAGDPGSRRHSARSLLCRAEADHAPLQRHLLRLQGRRRGAAAQPAADQCRDHPGAVALIATQTQIVGWAKRSVPTIPLLVWRDGGHGAYAPLPTLRNPGLPLAHLLPKP